MNFTRHRYQNTELDFLDIHQFIKELTYLNGKPQVWEFVRLEFWQVAEAFYSNDPDFLLKNACLWRDEEGKLRGLFISENGGTYFSVLVHPDYHYLTKEIVEYAKYIWGKDKEKLETDGFNHCHEVNTLLELGFKNAGQIGNTRKYDLTSKTFPVVLEEGYSIKNMKDDQNYLGKWESIFRTYNPNKNIEGDTRYWRKDLYSYDEELDLSVISPDGVHVSFCYGFVDTEHQTAIIETVGTLPTYQKRGFGKAVITECFRRLKERGVKTAYITGFSEAANALYQSLDPVEIYPLIKYTLDKETN